MVSLAGTDRGRVGRAYGLSAADGRKYRFHGEITTGKFDVTNGGMGGRNTPMKGSYGLDQRTHQGYYGEAFVRALAASAGLVVSRPDLDVTGEDFTLGYPGRRGSLRHPKIEVQVKSWCQPGGTPTTWRYRMRAEHFNELAGGQFYLRRYLFLIIVPADVEQYTHAADDALRLCHAGYWASFAHLPPIGDARSITVDVPRKNLLTAASLRSLLPAAQPTILPGPRGAT